MAINQERVNTLDTKQRERYDFLVSSGDKAKARTFLQNKTPNWQPGATTGTTTTTNTGLASDPPVTGRGAGSETPILPVTGEVAVDNTAAAGSTGGTGNDGNTAPTTTPTTPATGGASPNPYGDMTLTSTVDPIAGVVSEAPTPFEATKIEGLGQPIDVAQAGQVDAYQYTAPEGPTDVTAAQSNVDLSGMEAAQIEDTAVKFRDPSAVDDSFKSDFQWTKEQAQDFEANRETMFGDQRDEVIKSVMDQFDRRMEPQFRQQTQQLNQDLVDRGIYPGSQQYNTLMAEMRQSHGDQRLDARNQAILTGGQEQTRLGEMGKERQLAQWNNAASAKIASGQEIGRLETFAKELETMMKQTNVTEENKVQLERFKLKTDEALENMRQVNAIATSNEDRGTDFNVRTSEQAAQVGMEAKRLEQEINTFNVGEANLGTRLEAQLGQEANIEQSRLEQEARATEYQGELTTRLANNDAEMQARVANMQSGTTLRVAEMGIFAEAALKNAEFEFLRKEGESDDALKIRLAEMNDTLQRDLSADHFAHLSEAMANDKELALELNKLNFKQQKALTVLASKHQRFAPTSQPQWRDHIAEIEAASEAKLDAIAAEGEEIRQTNAAAGKGSGI